MASRQPARESHDGLLFRQLMAGLAWVSALDGGLLSDRSWRRRHLVVCILVTINAAITVPLAIASKHGAGLWLPLAILVVALGAAWLPLPGRRTRVLAVVLACFLIAGVANSYLANLSALVAGYVVLISVYQDWLPLAIGAVGALYVPVVAIVSPHTVSDWRAFEAEPPLTGAAMRTLGVLISAGAAVLVWRANGVAARDALTGFATRDHAERRLGQALRSGRKPAVFVCDVDAFRLAADDLARPVADELIRDVGHRLRAAAGASDTIFAAAGGAKYLVVRLGDTDAVEADALARQLCRAVARSPFRVQEAGIPLTVTVGIALGDPADEASDLLRAADIAMRRAKGTGDAAVGIADRTITGTRPRPDGPLTAELRRAVERDEFVMYYQPLVDLRSGLIRGAEALVRWQHPTRGLLFPDAFLPQSDAHPWLNKAISNAINSSVLRQAAAWQTAFPGRLPAGIALNLAPSRLKDPGLCPGLLTAIHDSGVDPGGIVVELTEGAVMDLEIDVPAVLADLAALGVRISLDDFGTGHSSLAHLRDFPLHEIKIDRSFVAKILESEPDRAVIRAVLAISSQFGADVVIEGVETSEQRDLLTGMHDGAIAQGYLFARPMSAAEFELLLEANRALPAPSLGVPVG